MIAFGPFEIRTRSQGGEPVTLWLTAVGVRRVVDHDGAQVSFIDFEVGGLLESPDPTAHGRVCEAVGELNS